MIQGDSTNSPSFSPQPSCMISAQQQSVNGSGQGSVVGPQKPPTDGRWIISCCAVALCLPAYQASNPEDMAAAAEICSRGGKGPFLIP